MKLLVPLRIPCKEMIWLAVKRDVGDNRDPAPDARFEGDRSTETSCSVEKLFAVLG
jgi:hypothetical protein